MEGFLRSEPRLVMSKVRLAAKVRHLGEAEVYDGNTGRAPSFRGYTLAIVLQLRKKSRRKSESGQRRMQKQK